MIDRQTVQTPENLTDKHSGRWQMARFEDFEFFMQQSKVTSVYTEWKGDYSRTVCLSRITYRLLRFKSGSEEWSVMHRSQWATFYLFSRKEWKSKDPCRADTIYGMARSSLCVFSLSELLLNEVLTKSLAFMKILCLEVKEAVWLHLLLISFSQAECFTD